MRLLYGCNILVYLLVQYAMSETITTDIGRIELLKELGRGSFGVVRLCKIEATGRNCAIKMEIRNDQSTLPMEEKCYKALGEHPGIPRMLYYGRYEEGEEEILVMELLGDSLMDIIEKKNLDKFSLKTVLLLGIQILYRIEYIHSKGILFMDNKPENWVMGGTELTNSLVHMLDFGLSVFYIENGEHVKEEPEVVGGSAAGTLRYIALYAHRHRTLSRREDIESIGYVLIYLLRGNVPWASQSGESKTGKSERVLKTKLATSLEDLVGPENPIELQRFMKYARSMSFYQEPSYKYLRRLLRDALANIGEHEDNVFDWSEPQSIITVPKNDKNSFWDLPAPIPVY